MKICHVTNAEGWSGGLEQMLLLLTELDRKGHQNILVCSQKCELLPKISALKNVKFFPLSIFQDYDLIAAWKLRWIIAKENPDIVHTHHAMAHAVALLALSFSPNPPLIVSRRVSFSPRKNPFSKWKYGSGRIKKYTVVSGAVKDTLVQSGIDPQKIEVVYSAVHPDLFCVSVDKETICRQLNIPIDYDVVGKVANYALWKGQHIFLQAAKEIVERRPKTMFVLVGKRTEQLAAMVAELKLQNHVRLLGFRKDIPNVIGALDVSVNAAIEGEGLSGAVRESFWLNVPVVASDVSGNREIVRNDETGFLVPPKNARALAEKIIYVLENKSQARQLATHGRNWVLQNATVEVMTNHLLDVYRAVLT